MSAAGSIPEQRAGTAATEPPVLSVRDLRITYRTGGGRSVEAVRGVSFDLAAGRSLALVGESGCGKSTLALGLLRLLPRLGGVSGGSVAFREPDGTAVDVLGLSGARLRQWRWSRVAMVFQGAMNAFNPVLRIEDQFADTLRAHGSGRVSRAQVRERAAAVLQSVRLEPERVLRSYPHELSGGMRQRVLIALALVLRPRVLVMDEPTTALDLLTQRAIVDMLYELRDELGFALVFISHDLALAAELADSTATMYAGRIVESGATAEVFARPRHPYTAGLLGALPRLRSAREPRSIPGAPPDLGQPPEGCAFAARCAHAQDACRAADPLPEPVDGPVDGPGSPGAEVHEAACLRHAELAGVLDAEGEPA